MKNPLTSLALSSLDYKPKLMLVLVVLLPVFIKHTSPSQPTKNNSYTYSSLGLAPLYKNPILFHGCWFFGYIFDTTERAEEKAGLHTFGSGVKSKDAHGHRCLGGSGKLLLAVLIL